MKKIKLLVYSPLLFLVLLVPYFIPESDLQPALKTEPETHVVTDTTAAPAALEKKVLKTAGSSGKASPQKNNSVSRKEIITYALSLLGKPYVWGGTSSKGFDCSGFTNHVFTTFGIKLSRSSTTQAGDGKPISREEAKPGDLVIFTGTNPNVRNPGHVGIVISQPGDTISFVHSSSNGGVKVSKIEGTRYNTRFLQIRRIL